MGQPLRESSRDQSEEIHALSVLEDLPPKTLGLEVIDERDANQHSE